MRLNTISLLNEYVQRRVPIDHVRVFIEDVDWDSADVPEDERSLLLQIEALLAGIDEGFNDESDLHKLILEKVQVFDWDLSVGLRIVSGSSNRGLSQEVWTSVQSVPKDSQSSLFVIGGPILQVP